MSTFAAAIQGVRGVLVEVEAHASNGLPGLDIVGMPERAVRESRSRIYAAINATGLQLPPRRFTINLAPADVPKHGSGFDAPIAHALLVAAGRLPDVPFGVLGEVGLDARIRPIRGLLPRVAALLNAGCEKIAIPASQYACISKLVPAERIFGIRTLIELADLACGQHPPTLESVEPRADESDHCFSDVVGQDQAKRALTIAAVGKLHTLFVGPPGCGKSMLAQRLPSILPFPTQEDAFEIECIRSLDGVSTAARAIRPFRAPHHSISAAALIGGGDPVQPGEITRAHRGVLFLDELPEFRRDAIETMRTVLEERQVTIVRARSRATLPADVLTVAAMNPCPCGNATHPRIACVCRSVERIRYANKISAPFAERFGVITALRPVHTAALLQPIRVEGDSSESIRKRVTDARSNLRGMPADQHALTQSLSQRSKRALSAVVSEEVLSARALFGLLRVAQCIGALDGKGSVAPDHIEEARSLRMQLKTTVANSATDRKHHERKTQSHRPSDSRHRKSIRTRRDHAPRGTKT